MIFKIKSNKKVLGKSVLKVGILTLFLLFTNTVFAQDLMEQAFSTARSYDTIIDIGNNKDSVGNTILREESTVGMNDNFGQGCFINGQFKNIDKTSCVEQGGDWNVQALEVNTKPPLIVRITKFLLRMTIVLSITMVIFNAIAYMIEVLNGKDWKSTEAKKNIMWVVGGVILALMSVGIINLIVSIPKSSVKTSDEVSSLDVGCKISSVIIQGDALKKEVCLKSTFGHPQNTMQYREWAYQAAFSHSSDTMENRALGGYRCRICENENQNCKRKIITDNEAKSKCVEDLSGTVL